MKTFNSYFLLLFLTFLSESSFAKVFVISDLDDTVRKANVINKADAAKRIIEGVKPFRNMIYLYREIFEEFKSRGEEVEFIYVSGSHRYFYNAPKWLAEKRFPQGRVFQKKFFVKGGTIAFKKDKIREILKGVDNKNDLVLFFGDNGQHDAGIYAEMVEELKLEKSQIFIRDVVTTALDISKELVVKNRLAGVQYFLGEKDLFKISFFNSFLPTWLLDKVDYEVERKRLIPNYVISYLQKRIKNEICKKIYLRTQLDIIRRRVCIKNSLKKAKKLISEYQVKNGVQLH